MDLPTSAPQGPGLHRAEGDKEAAAGGAKAKDEEGEPQDRREQRDWAGGGVLGLSWTRRPQGPWIILWAVNP